MSEERVPRWHPIEALPMIGEAIDGMLDSCQEVVRSLEQARSRPHILDDYTIGRVREAHGTQLNDLWWYTEQLARWHQANPTPAQVGVFCPTPQKGIFWGTSKERTRCQAKLA